MTHALPYWRLSGFYFCYFALLGATAPFLSLYFHHLGFSSARIGELMAIPMLTRCVAPNLWGWLGDRSGRRLLIVRLGALCTLCSFAAIFYRQDYTWLALVMAYWVLESPERAGLGFAFLAGLLADVAVGTVLGEQALRMVILAFILDRFRNRLRFFPTWQQALAIGALLLNDRIVSTVIRAMAGAPQSEAATWLSPVTGALLWGPLFVLLDALRHGRGRG